MAGWKKWKEDKEGRGEKRVEGRKEKGRNNKEKKEYSSLPLSLTRLLAA